MVRLLEAIHSTLPFQLFDDVLSRPHRRETLVLDAQHDQVRIVASYHLRQVPRHRVFGWILRRC